jgi:hypothetical protein
MTQAEMILRHLERGNTITSFQSFRLFACTRLPDLIRDLREKGHPIESVTIKLPSGRRCSQYFLAIPVLSQTA